MTRVKTNAVAFGRPPMPDKLKPRKRGRPREYGEKIRLVSLLQDENAFLNAKSPIYGETGVTLRYRVADLLWRPVPRTLRHRPPSHTRLYLANGHGLESVTP